MKAAVLPFAPPADEFSALAAHFAVSTEAEPEPDACDDDGMMEALETIAAMEGVMLPGDAP